MHHDKANPNFKNPQLGGVEPAKLSIDALLQLYQVPVQGAIPAAAPTSKLTNKAAQLIGVDAAKLACIRQETLSAEVFGKHEKLGETDVWGFLAHHHDLVVHNVSNMESIVIFSSSTSNPPLIFSRPPNDVFLVTPLHTSPCFPSMLVRSSVQGAE